MAKNLDPVFTSLYGALDRLKDRCLRSDGSLFSDGKSVWTLANVLEAHRRFNENPDESASSFVEKLALQMEGAPDSVLQLFGELMWLHFSCAADVSGVKKREHIERVLGWMKSPTPLPSDLGAALNEGMASTGVAFNTYRAQQLWFLIDFAKTWKELPTDRMETLLTDPWEFKSFLFDVPIEAAYVQRNALLHLLHPDIFQDIWSRSNKAQVAKAFGEFIPADVTDVDRRLQLARAHVVKTFPQPTDESRYWCPFYWTGVREQWEESPDKPADSTPKTEQQKQRVWLFSPGAKGSDWSRQKAANIMGIGWEQMGDLSRFNTKEEVEAKVEELWGDGPKKPVHTKRAMVDVRFRIRPGDIVIAKKGRKKILGVGVVEGPYRNNPNKSLHHHEFDVNWFHVGEWGVEDWLSMKTLTDLTPHGDFVSDLYRTIGLSPEDIPLVGEAAAQPTEDTEPDHPAYGITDALADLFVDETDLATMVELLQAKKNLVLTGPPGTGKTFLAARLGYLLAQEKNPERICRVQFHQSMSYEDFVQGYRPSGDGFQRRNGPFVQFCRQAAQDDRPHVLLIDEINRGNLSRIFGELMLLIESDKRSAEWATRLAYATDEDKPFWVPDNVYIVGTMNTADRSLALVDYALRRRFAFWSVGPAFDHEGLHRHLEQNGMATETVERVVGALHALNGRIKSDPNLGEGFCIGHSYFCELDGSRKSLSRLIKTELAPLLREYWFDDPERANEEIRELERVV